VTSNYTFSDGLTIILQRCVWYPGGVLPSNRLAVMCRWMGSQERNILYLLSPKFWWLCTRKLAKCAGFISLSIFLCREEFDAAMVLTLFLQIGPNHFLSIHDSLFQAFRSMVGSGQKLVGRGRKLTREKIEPQSPFVFFPSCSYLRSPRTI